MAWNARIWRLPAESVGCKDRVIFNRSGQRRPAFLRHGRCVRSAIAQRRLAECFVGSDGREPTRGGNRSGGVPEMVTNNESALLVPSNDPKQLASAIANLLTDKDLAQRLARQAATLVDTQHSPEIMFEP